jgi:hypothetical protein
MNELIKSKKFKIASIAIGSIILALLFFSAGVSVGIRKARFSGQFGENYERNFMGPKGGRMGGPMNFMRGMEGRDFRNAHGIAGTIISIADNSIIIKDRDDRENTITVSDKTIIKRGRDNIKVADLKNDEQIVVMGRPGDSGAINADLIRIFDNNNPANGQN